MQMPVLNEFTDLHEKMLNYKLLQVWIVESYSLLRLLNFSDPCLYVDRFACNLDPVSISLDTCYLLVRFFDTDSAAISRFFC